MKRGLLIFLLLLPIVQAIGVTPSSENINFRPNLEKEIPFNFFPTNSNINISIQLSGDLVEYASLSKTQISGGETIIVKISLPSKLEGGLHFINVHGIEKPSGGGAIAASSGITVPIRIFVPYDGQYIESVLEIQNVNVNEEATVNIHVRNIGTQPVSELYSKILILNNENIVKDLTTKKTTLNTEETKTLTTKFSTNDLTQGPYKAIATIFYDKNKEIIEKEFLIGDLIVNVINYTKTAFEHEISKFSITIESKWNNGIEEVFSDITILKNDQIILTTTTPTTSLNPWETKDLETFLELFNVDEGEYDLKIDLNYADQQTITKGKLKVIKRGLEFNQQTIAALTVVFILIILILWYVLLKKRGKNAKKP